MIDLPLFPLNTVLFPGIPFQLHIFEERYQLMVADCLENQSSFGVALIKQGAEALGPVAEPYPIGCTAKIVNIEHLDEGRMNITVVGMERFRIQALSYEKPYLVGTVELLPYKIEDLFSLQVMADRLRPLVQHYLQLLSVSEGGERDFSRLPDNPLNLACLGAYLLQVPLRQKQNLLTEEQANIFLASLTAMFPREIMILEKILDEPEGGSIGAFSVN